MNKRIYRSDDPIIAGVCGGIAEYLELDPTLIRILFIIICFFGFGTPILIYLVIFFIMPKRPANQTGYIDVQASGEIKMGRKPSDTAKANVNRSVAANVSDANGTPKAAAPGSAYTAANPQAYDSNPAAYSVKECQGLSGGARFGLSFAILLIGFGIVGLLGAFYDISFWRFWPLVLAALGLFIIFSPNSKGWSLERAGHGIFVIALAIFLQFWVLGFFGLGAVFSMLMLLCPALLVTIGLGIIASITKQNVFNLLGSLVLAGTLIFGVWFFGEIPGFSVDLKLPLLEDAPLRLHTPASPNTSVLPD